MKICSLRNETPLENEGEDVNKKPRMQREHRLAQRLPACRRLLFPFPRATKEIGDVCTQATQRRQRRQQETEE